MHDLYTQHKVGWGDGGQGYQSVKFFVEVWYFTVNPSLLFYPSLLLFFCLNNFWLA